MFYIKGVKKKNIPANTVDKDFVISIHSYLLHVRIIQMDRARASIPRPCNNILCLKIISEIGFVFLNYSFFSRRILFFDNINSQN